MLALISSLNWEERMKSSLMFAAGVHRGRCRRRVRKKNQFGVALTRVRGGRWQIPLDWVCCGKLEKDMNSNNSLLFTTLYLFLKGFENLWRGTGNFSSDTKLMWNQIPNKRI